MTKRDENARVSIRLPSPLWRRTQIDAIRRGINAQDIVNEALRLWFKKGGDQNEG